MRTRPEVAAPKSLASMPRSSVQTRTPGTAAARYHRPVRSQSLVARLGLNTETWAATRLPHAARIFSSSARLAIEHGQRGCRKRIRFGRRRSKGITEFDGQRLLRTPVSPGDVA